MVVRGMAEYRYEGDGPLKLSIGDKHVATVNPGEGWSYVSGGTYDEVTIGGTSFYFDKGKGEFVQNRPPLMPIIAPLGKTTSPPEASSTTKL